MRWIEGHVLHWSVLGFSAFVAPFCGPAQGDGLTDCAPHESRQSQVAAVLGPSRIRLDDGRVVRLAGIGPAPGDDAEAAADRLHRRLDALLTGHKVQLRFFDKTPVVDRHGAIVSHVVRHPDAVWIAALLVSSGAAIQQRTLDGAHCARILQQKEGLARRTGRGIWAGSVPLVRAAADPALVAAAHAYRLVAGDVLSVGTTKSRLYLNFGDDWSLDFTASIMTKDLPRFIAAGMDPHTLTGKRVRLRGWMDVWRGPHMRLHHPEQVEMVTKDEQPE